MWILKSGKGEYDLARSGHKGKKKKGGAFWMAGNCRPFKMFLEDA